MGARGSGRKRLPAAMTAAGPTGAELAWSEHPPQCPPGAPAAVRTVFRRLCKVLPAGVLKGSDGETLYALAAALWVHHEAVKALAADGPIYADAAHGGRLAKHPATTVMAQAAGTIKSLGAAFGLSPADRAAIQSMMTDDDPTSITDLLSAAYEIELTAKVRHDGLQPGGTDDD